MFHTKSEFLFFSLLKHNRYQSYEIEIDPDRVFMAGFDLFWNDYPSKEIRYIKQPFNLNEDLVLYNAPDVINRIEIQVKGDWRELYVVDEMKYV